MAKIVASRNKPLQISPTIAMKRVRPSPASMRWCPEPSFSSRVRPQFRQARSLATTQTTIAISSTASATLPALVQIGDEIGTSFG